MPSEQPPTRVHECPTCCSPVEVVSSDEGTHHYRPAPSEQPIEGEARFYQGGHYPDLEPAQPQPREGTRVETAESAANIARIRRRESSLAEPAQPQPMGEGDELAARFEARAAEAEAERDELLARGEGFMATRRTAQITVWEEAAAMARASTHPEQSARVTGEQALALAGWIEGNVWQDSTVDVADLLRVLAVSNDQGRADQRQEGLTMPSEQPREGTQVERCVTCGSPVEVVTSDEGTSCYRPAQPQPMGERDDLAARLEEKSNVEEGLRPARPTNLPGPDLYHLGRAEAFAEAAQLARASTHQRKELLEMETQDAITIAYHRNNERGFRDALALTPRAERTTKDSQAAYDLGYEEGRKVRQSLVYNIQEAPNEA